MLKLSRAALLAATLGLAAPVLPVFAQDTTGQTTPAMPFSFEIKIPSVTAVDSSMSEDQIKTLFTPDFLKNAEQLAALNATSITIPELTLSFAVDGPTPMNSNVTLRDIVLTNVVNGRADTLTIASTESNSAGETSSGKSMTAEGFDLKRLLEFTGIVKGDPTAALSPIYSSVTSLGSTQTGPVYSCSTGESSSGAIEAKPVSVTIGEILALVEQFKDASEPPPEAIDTIVRYGVDLLRGFRGGAGTIGAVDCSVVVAEPPISVKIAGATNGDFESAVYPNITVSGISVDAGQLGTGGLGEFVLKSIDLNPTLNALEGAAGQLNEAWFDKNWRLLIPSWDGLSFANFAIDAINPDNPTGDRIQAKVANFDISLDNYVVGIPTDLSISASGVEVPLPQTSTDPQITTLLAAGLTGVNLGADIDVAWDEATSTINVDKVSLAGVDLGSMSISATVGNATKQLFDVDPNVAMAAGFAVTVKNVTINVTDDGLGEIVWPLAAAEQGLTDVAAFRTQMAGFAEGFAIQLLGPTDAARQLGAALGEFVTGGKGEVTINITAKDPAGIPMAMFMAAQNDPSILAGQVEITGMAN